MAQNKKLKIEVEIQANDTPMNWTFEMGISGLETLALWTIVRNNADKQIDKLLGNERN